jgi:putative tryptophan/tyrosine transport system substrate-binding protein
VATSLAAQSIDLAGKRIELLREIAPPLHRLAIVANAGYPSVRIQVAEIQQAARTVGIQTSLHNIRAAEDIASTMESLRGRADGLFVPADPLVNSQRAQIGSLAASLRLPTIFSLREYVIAGGLMSYGPNIPDLFGRAGEIVDKVLRGAKPADIPVEQPTKFDFVINSKVAKALGISIPATLLARADEVIE